MSLRWYAEERRRTRTFDSPPVDHDFESFRIIFCALRDAERASDASLRDISSLFSPPFPPFALTHANYPVLPVTGFVFLFSLSLPLLFSRTNERNERRKRADDRWERRGARSRGTRKQRVLISARRPESVPRCTHARTFLSVEASIQVQGPIRLGCSRSADRYYDH